MSNKLPFWLKPHVSFLNKDSMHHAFLISGRKGVGKSQLVHYLSAFILCNDNDIEVCGNCSSCKFSSLENHPDYHELQILPDLGSKLLSKKLKKGEKDKIGLDISKSIKSDKEFIADFDIEIVEIEETMPFDETLPSWSWPTKPS